MRMACDLDERSLKSVARLLRFTVASRTSLSRCAWEDTGARRKQGSEGRCVSMAAFGPPVSHGPRQGSSGGPRERVGRSQGCTRSSPASDREMDSLLAASVSQLGFRSGESRSLTASL